MPGQRPTVTIESLAKLPLTVLCFDERAGLLSALGDPARAITAVLNDDSLAARRVGHGHALARELCSAAGMAAEHESLYRSLTGSEAQPSASRGRR
jgi:hypothetical protein